MSEAQAKAILDLRLHRLTGLERDKIGDELRAITDQIAFLLSILGSREKMLEVLVNELLDVKARFGVPRRTALVDSEFEEDIEELIQREDMVVTITHGGYIKRVPLSTYRAQRRGGKGRTGTALKDEDFVSDLFVASTHTPLLIFTSKGIVHKMKVWQLPLATPQSRGKALVNLLPLGEKENISVYMRLPEDEDVWSELDIIFATSAGGIRRNKLSDFGNIRSNGLIAMKLEGDERLVSVKIAREDEDVMLTTKLGKAIRFELNDVRVFAGRTSTGVRGIKLGKGDEVISMSTLRHVDATPEERTAYLKKASQLRGMDMEGVEFEDGDVAMAEDRFKELQNKEQFLITVTNKGYGKRTSAYEYRLTGRGGQGVTNMGLTSKNGGEVVATFPVTDDHQVMLVTDAGQLIRTPVKDVRFTGRSAQGVIVFRVGESESVISVAWLIQEDEDETLEQGDDTAQLTESDAPSLPAEE
jgi:DNA gyrase subunit A